TAASAGFVVTLVWARLTKPAPSTLVQVGAHTPDGPGTGSLYVTAVVACLVCALRSLGLLRLRPVVARVFGSHEVTQSHALDPCDNMTDEQLDAELDDLFRREPASVTISIRMPAELLERTKRLAAEGGVPYQTLIKRLVDAGVSRLEQRTKRRAHGEVAGERV